MTSPPVASAPAEDPSNYQKQARKVASTLFAAQSLGSAGYIAIATVGSIVAADLSGRDTLAGLAGSVGSIGAAIAAYAIGLSLERFGRRSGLTLGVLVGMLGAVLAGLAVVKSWFILFLVGLGLVGFAQAAIRLGRFVAAEVFMPDVRGRALSVVVLGGTVGAVLGPLLVGPTGRLASNAGLSELAGPYSAAVVLYAITVLVLYIFLRPDPKLLARQIEALAPRQEQSGTAAAGRSFWQLLRTPSVAAAMGAMIFGQAVMVTLMVITSLHMRHHNHSLDNISIVFSMHTLGMFAPSILSGWLTDRWGRSQVILFGAIMLIFACLLAPVSHELVPMAVALLFLGLGWNFCYVGGSTLLSDLLTAAEKTRAQGINDLLLAFISALGSLSSGFIYAGLGYSALGLITAALSFIPIVLLWRWQALKVQLS